MRTPKTHLNRSMFTPADRSAVVRMLRRAGVKIQERSQVPTLVDAVCKLTGQRKPEAVADQVGMLHAYLRTEKKAAPAEPVADWFRPLAPRTDYLRALDRAHAYHAIPSLFD